VLMFSSHNSKAYFKAYSRDLVALAATLYNDWNCR
jgi:hypothetical protein